MHCFSNCACGLPFAGGTSLVAESGAPGLKVLPPFVVTVVPGALVVAGTEEVEMPGEVTAGIETVGAVVSPELSLPQPAAINPMASASGMRARLTSIRRGPAGEVRSRGSR